MNRSFRLPLRIAPPRPTARPAQSWLVGLLILAVSVPAAQADLIEVPGDQATIQAALDVAIAGDTIEVADGIYFEKIEFPRSGTINLPILLRPAPGANPVLDGTGVSGSDMVRIENRSYVQIEGFEIRNHTGVTDGSGVRVLGAGDGVEIRSNRIHDIRGSNAMGITVYGTEAAPISGLVIDDNEVFDCDPAPSEAITLNGNVTDFVISNNIVRDVNNIGIDCIGGETDIQPDSSLVARNGVVRGNTVLRANSIYGGGYAGGIYVDGGRDIVIENNRVGESDLGIEIGAENAGLVTDGIVVRNNVLHHNERAGLVFGGYASNVGRANGNLFVGNTLYANNTVGEDGIGTYFVGGGIGEIWIQFGADNVIAGNLVFAGPENVYVGSFDSGSSINNTFDYNLYFGSEPVAAGDFSLNGNGYIGFDAWRTATGMDPNSLVANPLLLNPAGGDFHLDGSSPAVDRGDPGYVTSPGEVDIDREPRIGQGRVDIGADEFFPALFRDGFESGDTTAW